MTRLCIGQLTKVFYEEKNGDVREIVTNCLKSKVGSTTIMEETPDHLPDIGITCQALVFELEPHLLEISCAVNILPLI